MDSLSGRRTKQEPLPATLKSAKDSSGSVFESCLKGKEYRECRDDNLRKVWRESHSTFSCSLGAGRLRASTCNIVYP